MIRVTRLTDYAVVLLVDLMRSPDRPLSVSAMAADTGLTEATIAKVLRPLGQAGLVEAKRGVNGGYMLARPAMDISIADVIAAMEGPIAITACVDGSEETCQLEHRCGMVSPWNRVNGVIRAALERVTLEEMGVQPLNFLTAEEAATV